MASLVFRTQDAPGYKPGLLTCLIAEAVIVAISASMIAYCASRLRAALADCSVHFANRRADRTGAMIEGHATFRCALPLARRSTLTPRSHALGAGAAVCGL